MFSLLFVLTAIVATTLAQSSPGAPYDIGNYLPVSWNGSATIEPGFLYQPNQVRVGPSYGAAQTNVSTSQPFVVILVDIDVVLNASTGVQSEFLHVLQPNLYALNGTGSNLTFLSTGPNASSVVGASYYSPIPPPGSTHNYNIFLFEQPANFSMPPNFTRFNNPQTELDRALFNVTEFANASGLGQPIAANYFRVLNGTAAQSSAVETQTGTSGVAFPTGYSFSTTSAEATSTTPSGTGATGSASGSAAAPTASRSSASDSIDLGQSFVKAVCMAVAASLPWIWS